MKVIQASPEGHPGPDRCGGPQTRGGVPLPLAARILTRHAGTAVDSANDHRLGRAAGA